MKSFSFNFTFWTIVNIINLNDNLYNISLDQHLQPQGVTVTCLMAAVSEPSATHNVKTWIRTQETEHSATPG